MEHIYKQVPAVRGPLFTNIDIVCGLNESRIFLLYITPLSLRNYTWKHHCVRTYLWGLTWVRTGWPLCTMMYRLSPKPTWNSGFAVAVYILGQHWYKMCPHCVPNNAHSSFVSYILDVSAVINTSHESRF